MFLSLLIVSTLLCNIGYSTTNNWTGNVSSDWNNGANWSSGLPASGDTIVIRRINYTGAAADPAISVNSSFSPSRITVRGTSILTIQADITTSGDVQLQDAGSRIDMSGGVFSIGGTLYDLVLSANAVMNVTGGTITTGDDLNINTGARLNFTAGSIITTDNLLIKDKGTSYSLLDMDGGTLVVGSDLQLDGANTTATATFDISGGTCTVTGKLLFEITTNGLNDYPHLLVTGGIVTCVGIAHSYTCNIDIDISGGTFTVSGPVTMNYAGDRIDQNGGRIIVQNTATWTNAGVVNATGGSTEFQGKTTLSGAGSFTFYNFIMNSASASPQLTFSTTDILVRNNITMSAGNINLNARTLTLGTSVSNIGSLTYTNGLLYNGTFKRWFDTNTIADGNAAGLFPMGTSSNNSRLFYISAPVSAPYAGGTASISHTDASAISNVSFPDGAATVVTRHDAFWTLSTADGLAGGTYNLRMEGTGFGTISDVDDLRLTLAGSVVGNAGTNSGTPATPQVNRKDLTLTDLANNFYLGSVNIILSVDLLHCEAKFTDNDVIVSWATASEKNNEFFTLERSRDGQQFEPVITVKGAGNSSSVLNYDAIDENPLSGNSYYRLRQTDYDGKFSFSHVMEVKTDFGIEFSVFPNPSDGSSISISLTGIYGEEILVVVLDMTGRQAYSQIVPAFIDGTFLIATDFSKKLTPGVYMVKASSQEEIHNQKLIIK